LARREPAPPAESLKKAGTGKAGLIFMADVSLTLLVLKTRQIERVCLFYGTLGIQFAKEQHGSGPVHFAGQAGDVVVEVYPLLDDGSAVDTSTRLGFAVANLPEIMRALEGIGIEIITRPKQTAWGFRGVVRDPDGRSVELVQR